MKHFDRMFAQTNRLRTEGLRNLLDAGRAAGARRIIAQSFTGWPFAREGGPVKDEDAPLDPRRPGAARVAGRDPRAGGHGHRAPRRTASRASSCATAGSTGPGRAWRATAATSPS